jgi:class 3 adenylate cyclase
MDSVGSTDTSPRTRLLAVLAADAVGYSRLMSLDDRGTLAALDAARAVFGLHIASHDGRVIDMAGDSVLAVFETATAALKAALAIPRQLGESAGTALMQATTLKLNATCAFALAQAYEPMRQGEHYALKSRMRLVSGVRP